MQTADQIVLALGGTTRLARALGLTPSTVQSWKEANFIPAWRQPALIRIAAKLKHPLKAADFPTPDQRVSRTRSGASQQVAA